MRVYKPPSEPEETPMKSAPILLACTLALAACATPSPTPAEVHEAARVAAIEKAADMVRQGYVQPPPPPINEAQWAADRDAYQQHRARTDAECRYEAAQGSSNTYGILMPAAVFGNLYQLCMRARS